MAGLERYSTHSYQWFNFHLNTENPVIIKAADYLLKEIGGYTGTKDRIKKEFMVKLLLNLKVSHITGDMISVMRTPKYYAAIPERYREETQSYETVIRITDLLKENEYIHFKKGGKDAEKHTHGVASKIHALDKIVPILNTISVDDLFIEPPRELIILRNSDKNDIDYVDTPIINKMRADLTKYNAYLSKQTVSLVGLSRVNIKSNIDYFKNYKLVDTMNIDILEENDFENIVLKNLHIHRIFNIDFKRGGRLNGGVELVPSVVRPYIHINGSPTVELDFSSFQLRMLYHKIKIDYRDDAYAALCDSEDPNERAIYKQVALTILNSADEETAVKSLRKNFADENLMPSGTKTDAKLKQLIEKFQTHHHRIKKYFHKGIGLKLNVPESEITNNILQHFMKKGILVLSVHDSYIIAAEHNDELLRRMKKEYKKIFKFDPVIK